MDKVTEHDAAMTQRQLAEHLNVCVGTVRKWNTNGCPRIYIGDAVAGTGSRPRYRIEEVRAWLMNRNDNKGKDIQQ